MTPLTTRSRFDAAKRHQGARRRREVRHHHPRRGRVEEFGLKQMWRSPNGTIRNILGGVVFREPIICSTSLAWCRAGPSRSSSAVTPTATSTAPPTSRRPRPATSRSPTPPTTVPSRWSSRSCTFRRAAASSWGCTTSTTRIRDFARASFRYGLQRNYPVYLSTKKHDPQAYDGQFKDLFQEVFDAEFAADLRRRRADLRAPPDR